MLGRESVADLGMLPELGLRLLGPLKLALDGLVPGRAKLLVKLDTLGRDSPSCVKDRPELDR